jgi:hypothetical protein
MTEATTYPVCDSAYFWLHSVVSNIKKYIFPQILYCLPQSVFHIFILNLNGISRVIKILVYSTSPYSPFVMHTTV